MPAIRNAYRGAGAMPADFAPPPPRRRSAGEALLAEIEACLHRTGMTARAFERAVKYTDLVNRLRDGLEPGPRTISRVRREIAAGTGAVAAALPANARGRRFEDGPAALLRAIETFLEITGISPTQFGNRVAGDSGFVIRLRGGGGVRPPTHARVWAFIDGFGK